MIIEEFKDLKEVVDPEYPFILHAKCGIFSHYILKTCICQNFVVILQAKSYAMSYIQSFTVENLWGHKNIHWRNINPDVNIIVGINGSGKTTLLNLMYGYYNSHSCSQATLQNGKSIVTEYYGIPERLEKESSMQCPKKMHMNY